VEREDRQMEKFGAEFVTLKIERIMSDIDDERDSCRQICWTESHAVQTAETRTLFRERNSVNAAIEIA
jgi:hypothetical protein